MTRDNRKIRAYLYPVTSRLTTGVYNPYLDHFMDSTGYFINYLNRQQPSKSGILNIFRFLYRIDILFLNWAENIPDKKGGLIQSIFLLMLLRLKSVFGIKIIWTLHNKISHSPEKLFLKRKLFTALLKKSDFIITHSKEGILFAESLLPDSGRKIFCFPHPVVPKKNYNQKVKNYDILIWGTIAPYKGIDSFLAFLKKNDLLERYRILISGKILSPEFHEVIKKYERSNITIENRFISDKELGEFIGASRAVLFTYSRNSVLSSGALTDSLSYGASVIGPNIGAFSDMRELGIIQTYDDFDQLPDIMQNIGLSYNKNEDEKLQEFIRSHTWDRFSKALCNKMKQNNLC